MEPGQVDTVGVTEAPEAAQGDPLVIGGSVLLALAVAGVLAVVVQRTLPRPSPPRIAPRGTEESTEDATTEADRTTEVPKDLPAPAGSMFLAALGRSRELLRSGFDRIFGKPIDDAALESLEEVLLRADVGIVTTERLLARVREAARAGTNDPGALRGVLKSEMKAMLGKVHQPFVPGSEAPWVVLVVGVNGSGKTTTIGKLAARLHGEGKKVLLAAGDTFRAAAEQQLNVWAERAGVDILALDAGADPGAVAYKAIERAKAQGHDVVIVDTAGRLQTRKPLMEQLTKIRRVLDKASAGAPHETLLVLDGTMGQNGMSQARLFHEATPLTGVVVTKLDGTAKGGMLLSIATELSLPVKLVGLGEKLADLRDFDPEGFVDALV